jgi:hypothetical protein
VDLLSLWFCGWIAGSLLAAAGSCRCVYGYRLKMVASWYGLGVAQLPLPGGGGRLSCSSCVELRSGRRESA